MRPRKSHFASLTVLVLWIMGVSVHAEELAEVRPLPTKLALDQEHLGLSLGEAFHLTTGQCADCRTPKPALWYFGNEIIAVPSNPDYQDGRDHNELPFLVWVGSHDVIESAELTEDGRHVRTADGQELGVQLAPKLVTNRSYFNEATQRFFSGRPLRLRGEILNTAEGRGFEARTIWPTDWRFTPETARKPSDSPSLPDLIEGTWTPGQQALITHTLWTGNTPRSNWNGRPVFGVILNGAQGDDDEALGGHVGIFTGRMGAHGEWADWLVNNFYDPDWVSEKGILPAMVPMDNYLGDLNSGQAYYRPSYLLVMVLKQDRVPVAYQRAIQQDFSALYRHVVDYDHAQSNCAGLSIDALRALGWHIPLQGPTSLLKAVAAVPYVTVTDRSFAKGLNAYHYLAEEQSRLLPRIMFEAIGTDLLALLNGDRSGHMLTTFEQWVKNDTEAVLFVQIPQIPSSRAWGAAPVRSLVEYEQRAPKDRKDWKIIPVPPRPFPENLREVPSSSFSWTSTALLLSVPLGVVLVWIQQRRKTSL